MKLSWRDIVTTALAIFGTVIVWAKLNNYSWPVIASWRSAVAVVGITGLLMLLFDGFDFANRSILNITEMVLGAAAVIAGIIGLFVSSPAWFYTLAALIAAAWLIDIARRIYHSIGGETTYHRHVTAH